MTDRTDCSDDETRLIAAITNFLRDQLLIRNNFEREDRESLDIAIQCLEMAYDLENNDYNQYSLQYSRSLMDIFKQVTNPVSVKDKIRADAHKDEGNNYMRRNMFADAETEYTNAIELDKWNAIYYANRASARIGRCHYFEAIDDCKEALMLNADYAKAHAKMGQAYALMHRSTSAARCFRQALELEPENERYRYNLRVAENEDNGTDPEQVITNLLTSLFESESQDSEDNRSRTLPTSLMIITEIYPPELGTSSQTTESAQNTESFEISQDAPLTRIGEQTNGTTTYFNEINNNMLPRPGGIIGEEAKENPILEFETPSERENWENFFEEFVINIPLATFGFDFVPTTQSLSSPADSSLQNTKTVDETPAEILQNNISEEETLPQHESETKSDYVENDFNKNVIPEEKVLLEKPCSSVKQNDNQSEKNTAQICLDENATDAEKKELEKQKTVLSSEKDSSNESGNERQNETKNVDENTNDNNNGTSYTEK